MAPGQFLIALAILLLFGAFIALLSPIGLLMVIGEKLRFRAFRRRESGNVYFVCTSRRNWHNFIRNNVIPILPDHYRVMWHTRRRGGSPPLPWVEFERSLSYNLPKPYLVVVTSRGLTHRSLNAILARMKPHQERSEHVRAACREMIDRIEQDLRSNPTSPARA